MKPLSFPGDGLVAGRYRPVAVLGTGGMGTVYEATDERLARPVALKLVHTTDPISAARLRAEATALASLRHPNVVTVFDTGEHEGRPFVVTELVRGRTLRRRMDEGPVAAEDLAAIGSQVASALACVHAHGIVHRDLTPGNVLLTEATGDARLIDFGIAATRHSLGLTVTGLVIGTPAYLSPEQVEGRTATPASDVYSLGIVLLEALTGEKAFPGTPTESAGARLVADAPVPADLAAGWGPLLAVMARREPALRPDATLVARRLADLPGTARGGSPTPEQDPTAITTTSPSLTTVAAAVDIGDRTGPRRPAGESSPMSGATTESPAWPSRSAAVERAESVERAEARSAAFRRRWPIAVAVLLAGLLVLAAFGASAGDRPVTGVDPTSGTTSDQVTVAPTSGAPTPVTRAPATTTTNGNGTTGTTADQGTPPSPHGQGKPKGRSD